jgi:hypothetical protein
MTCSATLTLHVPQGLKDTKDEVVEAFQKKILEAVNFCLAQMQATAEADMTG